jgi:hypothetical protein
VNRQHLGALLAAVQVVDAVAGEGSQVPIKITAPRADEALR